MTGVKHDVNVHISAVALDDISNRRKKKALDKQYCNVKTQFFDSGSFLDNAMHQWKPFRTKENSNLTCIRIYHL